jgi:2,3,4,5-tetrahydropyridine-2-carboxylate N-succinyltransferase
MPSLQSAIERLATLGEMERDPAARKTFLEFRERLTQGKIRAAEKINGEWKVNAWVKQGILLGFRLGEMKEMSEGPVFSFVDKDTYPARHIALVDCVRVVPGGSTIREGAYVAPSVICMPPMFINVGAYVDEGTMVDSHALIGSCAQVGRNCHVSAAAQIGGVIEPVGAMPVIIEDDVMIGGNSGVYEGTIVKKRAVLGTGTVLNRSTPVYDLVKETIYSAKDDEPLVIPEEAIVVPGARAVTHPAGKKWGLSLYAAVIVKYRDGKTDARVQLEDLLR